MTYIIENANILKEDELVTTSFLVKDNHIAFMSKNFKKYSYMKMNVEPYIMTPTYVIFDSLQGMKSSFQEKKQYFLERFIQKGSTTLLTYVDVKYERELSAKLKSKKVELIGSPIDYIIGVKIPIKLLTPEFIRKCKREKIPVLFIELSEEDDLQSIPWGWIREAMFPYNSLLVPYFHDSQINKRLVQEWKVVLEENKIHHVDSPFLEGAPLTIQLLSKMGIYPIKSSLIQGGELSYNLYRRSREINNIDVQGLFHYHNDRLVITVHKGVVIRAAQDGILFRSGFGEYVTIKMPSYFSIS
ncbi:hypothetical protein [Neobacillus sp. D3-1R]|uniref:hypothetical protein n=1 Tax=Neobacillus sp. D3-1R TaxID=3445778 RepID=UPI003FA0A2EA